MSFGSGFGTFVPVYPMFERARDVLADHYANHAHDDVLEMWLGSGIYGPILAGLFLFWLGQRAKAFWRKVPVGARALDALLMRAASIVIVLLFAHSFVDYPLRTGTMVAVSAFSCALLVEPWGAAFDESISVEAPPSDRRGRNARGGHQWAADRPKSMVPWTAPNPVPAAPQQTQTPPRAPNSRQSGNRWGEDIEWPAEVG